MSTLIKKTIEFLIIGAKLSIGFEVNKKDVLNSILNLHCIFDTQLALDYLLEESPIKVVYNHDINEDLF